MSSLSSHQWENHHRQLEVNFWAWHRRLADLGKIPGKQRLQMVPFIGSLNCQLPICCSWFGISWQPVPSLRLKLLPFPSPEVLPQSEYMLRCRTSTAVREWHSTLKCTWPKAWIIPFCRQVLPDFCDDSAWPINWPWLREHRKETRGPKTYPPKTQCWYDWGRSKRAHQSCAQNQRSLKITWESNLDISNRSFSLFLGILVLSQPWSASGVLWPQHGGASTKPGSAGLASLKGCTLRHGWDFHSHAGSPIALVYFMENLNLWMMTGGYPNSLGNPHFKHESGRV